MDTLKPSALTTELLNTEQSGVPLVICSEAPRVRKRIESAGYQEVKINKTCGKGTKRHAQLSRSNLCDRLRDAV